MKILNILTIYIKTVDQLMNQELPDNARLFIEAKQKGYISFRPKDFRLKLQKVSGEKDINKYLNTFKKLGLIVTPEKDTFTNVQRHKKKIVRVIAIERCKFETIRELMLK